MVTDRPYNKQNYNKTITVIINVIKRHFVDYRSVSVKESTTNIAHNNTDN